MSKTMTLDEAHEINKHLTNIGLYGEGAIAPSAALESIKALRTVKLQDMIACAEVIRAEEEKQTGDVKTYTLTVGDRLAAAIFVTIHYEPGSIVALTPHTCLQLIRNPSVLTDAQHAKHSTHVKQ